MDIEKSKPHLEKIHLFLSNFYCNYDKEKLFTFKPKIVPFDKEEDGRHGDPLLEYAFGLRDVPLDIKGIQRIFLLQDWDKKGKGPSLTAREMATRTFINKDYGKTFTRMNKFWKVMDSFEEGKTLIINAVPGLRDEESSLGALAPETHACAFKHYWFPVLKYIKDCGCGNIPVYICGAEWIDEFDKWLKLFSRDFHEKESEVEELGYKVYRIDHPYAWFTSKSREKLETNPDLEFVRALSR